MAGSALFTDAPKTYEGLNEFQHVVADHALEYVRGEVHTTGLENFWSLFKRGLNGTYVSVEPFHLFRYLDELTFRYNNRKGMNDKNRLDLAVCQMVGKRLHVRSINGKTRCNGRMRMNDQDTYHEVLGPKSRDEKDEV